MNSSQKSYSLENTIKEMIFREDLFLYNCLQIKTWIASGAINDKTLLTEKRKYIESVSCEQGPDFKFRLAVYVFKSCEWLNWLGSGAKWWTT